MKWSGGCSGGFLNSYNVMYVVPQVAGEDEGVREKAIEYVSTSLMSMRHILFIPHPDNEKRLLTHVKKVSFTKSTFYFSIALLVICLYSLPPSLSSSLSLFPPFSLPPSPSPSVSVPLSLSVPLPLPLSPSPSLRPSPFFPPSLLLSSPLSGAQ